MESEIVDMDTMRNLSRSKDLPDRSLSKKYVGFPFEIIKKTHIAFFHIIFHDIFMLFTYYSSDL